LSSQSLTPQLMCMSCGMHTISESVLVRVGAHS